MEDALTDETMLRRYLLGQLGASPELANELHDRMLSDESLSEMVGIIEDEIIEDYLDGTLNATDRQAVEEHFLRPPERQKKLHFARRLEQYLQAEREGAARASDPEQKKKARIAPWWSQFRTYAEIAAGLVVIVAGTFYIRNLRQGFQAEIGKNRHELTSERDRSALLAQQAQDLRGLQQPSTVMLSLLRPGMERGNAQLPEVAIGSETQRIHVEILLPTSISGPCDVRLETSDGKVLWAQNRQWPFKSQNASLLILDVPAQDIGSSYYRFVISQSPQDNPRISYAFQISRPYKH